MERSVKILHKVEDGKYESVFDWQTKKKGMTVEVVDYLVTKFQDKSAMPVGYESRPLQKGDRIQLTSLEGDGAGIGVTYELVTDFAFKQI